MDSGNVRKLHVPDLLCDQPCELALAGEAMRDYARFSVRCVQLDDLTSSIARLVIETATGVWERGERVSITAVATELQRVDRIRTVGGTRGLADLSTGEAVPDHKRVRELAELRRLRDSGAEIVRAASEGDRAKAMTAAQDAERNALGSDTRKVISLGEAAEAEMAFLRERTKVEQHLVYPGLEQMFAALGFFSPGDLIVIGADSNVGKSGVALEMLLGCAARGVGCGLVSVEDSSRLTGRRAIAAFSGVSARKMQHNRYTDEDLVVMERAARSLRTMADRMMFADCTGETEFEVCAAMTQMAARGARMVIVDYLTEVDSSRPFKDYRLAVKWVCKRLKTHAKRLGIVLVVVSQLSRPQDKAVGKRPTKHDLKESGDVTNQADAILLLWRMEESDDALVLTWVAKGKSGGIGQWWQMERKESGRLEAFGPVHRSLRDLPTPPRKRPGGEP